MKSSATTAVAFDQDQSFMLVDIDGNQLSFQTISRTGTTVDSWNNFDPSLMQLSDTEHQSQTQTSSIR
jgi:glucose-6-phosphate isomerase